MGQSYCSNGGQYAPLSEQFFGNMIGSQKRTHLQQLRSSRMGMVDALKGERPGRGNRVGIVRGLRSPPGKQGAAVTMTGELVLEQR
jgi:hypothetical protein